MVNSNNQAYIYYIYIGINGLAYIYIYLMLLDCMIAQQVEANNFQHEIFAKMNVTWKVDYTAVY